MSDIASTQPALEALDDVEPAPEILISTDELLRLLDIALDGLDVASVGKFASIAGVTAPAVSHVRRGDRPPNRAIAAALGYRKYTGWEPIPGWRDRHGLFGERERWPPILDFIEIEE